MNRILSLVGLAALTVLVAGGCTAGNPAPGVGGNTSTANLNGPRGPLTDPADNTLNSPVTGPTSSGLSGGTAGTGPSAGSTTSPSGIPVGGR